MMKLMYKLIMSSWFNY